MTASVDCPRLPRPVEPRARADKIEQLEPETEAQYADAKATVERIAAIRLALLRIDHHLSQMPYLLRDEVEGRTGVYRVDMATAIAGALECQRKLEAGIRAWETRPADTIMEDV